MGDNKDEKEGVVTLNDTKTIDTTPKTTTTATDDRSIITTSSKSLSPEAAALNEQQADEFAKQHGIDRSKGEYVGPIGNLLGFDPNRFLQQQKEDERLERFKQKEAGWANALGVIIDAATAGHGGDVYQRKPDGVAAKAKEKADKARDNVYALGETIQKAKDAKVREWQAAERQRNNDFLNKYMQTRSEQFVPGKVETKTTEGGKKTTTTIDEQQLKGGSNNKKTKKANFVSTDGKSNIVELKENDYNLLGEALEVWYKSICNQFNEDGKSLSDYSYKSRNKLESKGIMRRDKSGNPTFDKDEILAHGYGYDLPDEIVDLIYEVTGGKIRFPKTGKVMGEAYNTIANKYKSGGSSATTKKFGKVDKEQTKEEDYDF